MSVGQFINRIKESEYLTIVFKESDNRFIESCQLFVWLITTWIVSRTTIEDISSTVTTLIFGDALTVRETINLDSQRSLRSVRRKSGRAVLRMRLIRVVVSSLVTICT